MGGFARSAGGRRKKSERSRDDDDDAGPRLLALIAAVYVTGKGVLFNYRAFLLVVLRGRFAHFYGPRNFLASLDRARNACMMSERNIRKRVVRGK